MLVSVISLVLMAMGLPLIMMVLLNFTGFMLAHIMKRLHGCQTVFVADMFNNSSFLLLGGCRYMTIWHAFIVFVGSDRLCLGRIVPRSP